MPRYEFKCDECGAVLTTVSPPHVQQPEKWACDETPDCKGTIRRVYSFGFQLKGSGWAGKRSR